MEEKMAVAAGHDFVSVYSASLKKGILSKISFFLKMSFGFLQSFLLIINFKPDYIVGFGGYTSFPILFAAILMKKNVTVHESNAVPGKVVRMLVKKGAKFAYSIAADNTKMKELISCAQKKSGAAQTGTPVRKSIIDASDKKGFEITGFDSGNPVILIIGGSQGSRCLNTTVADGICLMKKNVPGIQVIHITGKNGEESVKDKYDKSNVKNFVKSFFDDIGAFYKIADVAVTRAGALTVSELSVTCLPAVLIPFPYATDNHQYENAMTMENAGSGKVISEKVLTSEMILNTLTEIISNENMKMKMRNAALTIAKPEADKLLCEFIEKNDR
jgi:UDP-N-acetylglucosamine--N-acetylmuramyl-(pentapeptide) pyrophosphoryl-undecaprenol N-acetylglucosamine transferase